jgi:SAM-dependent methyltransferase
MHYQDRVPEALFKGKHYLGRPADFTDSIVQRRVDLALQVPGFANPAHHLVDIAPHFNTCTGLEYEPTHQPEFDQALKATTLTNCEFKAFNIEQKTPDQQYERMISFEVIEHLSSDTYVSNYYHTLKPGGIAIFTVPNKWWIFETHGARLPWLPWNRVPLFSWLPTPIHERFANARIYTRPRIRRVLENAGFQVQRIDYLTAPLDVLKPSKIKTWLLKHIFNTPTCRVPFMATSLFIVAHKTK